MTKAPSAVPASLGTAPKNAITLAPADEPGSSLYNSYHFLTQLSGLYAQAAQYSPDKHGSAIWGEVCDLAIADLGALFHAWEAVLAEARAGRPAPLDAKVASAVIRACRRAEVLTALMSVWTPMSRWARIMTLSECRWQRFLVQFEAASPAVKTQLGLVRTGSKNRQSRLVGLTERYRQDEGRATAALNIAARTQSV